MCSVTKRVVDVHVSNLKSCLKEFRVKARTRVKSEIVSKEFRVKAPTCVHKATRFVHDSMYKSNTFFSSNRLRGGMCSASDGFSHPTSALAPPAPARIHPSALPVSHRSMPIRRPS